MKAKVIEIKNDIIQDILSEIDYEFERNGGEVPRFITDFLFEINEIIYKPTLEEVKKEWKKLDWNFRTIEYGFKVTKLLNNQVVQIFALKHIDNTIHILANNIATKAPIFLTLQEHNLLTKTFRALKWMD